MLPISIPGPRSALVCLIMAVFTLAGCTDSGKEAGRPDNGAPGDLALETTQADPNATAGRSLIDRDRLLGHVRTLASDAYRGREAGTEGGRRAADYVLAQMRDTGIEACLDSLVASFDVSTGENGESFEARNIVGLVRGTEYPDRFIVVTAHFDHLGVRQGQIYNGADDNASGTSALIELARYFAGHPARHTLVFAALDAEEKGLMGARAFLESDCARVGTLVQNVNLDMVSRSAALELYASGTYHHPEFVPVLDTLDASTELDLLFGHDEPGTGSDDWTMASDHGPFHAEGIPFMYFGVEDHPGYHQPTDDFADITPDFFHEAAGLILRALQAFDRYHHERAAE